MAKREVITIKEDVEISKGVFLSKGDMVVESGKGRWMIIEADADEDEDEKKDKKEESEDGDEDDMDDEDDKKDEKKKK